MKRGLLIGAVLAALWVGFWGCSKGKEDPKSGEKAGTRPPVAVEADVVQAKDLIEGIEVVGSLAAKYEANLRSEYAGIVTQVYVTEWIHVKKGTPLAK
ncbi:MAG: efflux RND transporter periplasmic adaptor subunit, partial [Desulfobacca sp.]|nr:efflux RND transporter periplasmic adaptor subunit [Desulfobacca sp.]